MKPPWRQTPCRAAARRRLAAVGEHSRRALTVYYPATWQATVNDATIVIRSADTRILPADYGPAHAEDFPRRPDRFRLDDDKRRLLSCVGFEGSNMVYADRGRVIQAILELGSGTRRSYAAEVLDRLAVD